MQPSLDTRYFFINKSDSLYHYFTLDFQKINNTQIVTFYFVKINLKLYMLQTKVLKLITVLKVTLGQQLSNYDVTVWE